MVRSDIILSFYLCFDVICHVFLHGVEGPPITIRIIFHITYDRTLRENFMMRIGGPASP